VTGANDERNTDSAPAPLRFRGLTTRFGSLTAVDAVTLDIPAGSFYGVVGPNGAGKTTLLSMAVGLVRPDEGTSEAGGFDLWTHPVEAKSQLGVLPESDFLPRRLTPSELLRSVGLLRGLSPAVVEERTEELLDVLGLRDADNTVIADFSTGMRKKAALAVALLHGPRVLVLDEPFESVDPVSAATIRSILAAFIASGGTIVFSSHVMALVEALCDHVAVVSAGKVVAAGPLDAVRGGRSLDEAFSELVGAGASDGTLSWFAS
jgi:ABC-2 type transport system ATP-binding protein